MPVVAAAQSKDFWQTKDYRQWNEKECKKLLEDSPWAQDYTFTRTLIEPLQRATGERAGESKPQMSYLAQFRSALPVRQALIRLQQINNKSANHERPCGRLDLPGGRGRITKSPVDPALLHRG